MSEKWDGRERRKNGDRRKHHRYVRWAFILWLILFTLAVGWSIRQLRELTQQNQDRITDIQKSRLDSCKQTYQSFHTVFDPFLPPKGHRTAKQKKDLKKFDAIISRKAKRCIQQVTPPPVTSPTATDRNN